jgi:hypothetical protein
MTTERTWTDDQLRAAVATATCWRAVLRELGLSPDGGGTGKLIRHRAAELALDTTHFRRNRSWSDDQLRLAVTDARTWDEAIAALGLSATGNSRAHIRAHAARLGLDTSHLEQPMPSTPAAPQLTPTPSRLRFAAESIAAAWFTIHGCDVATPATPCPYDLLVSMPDGIKRVQVKTTISVSKDGWSVYVSKRPYSIRKDAPMTPYSPEEVDLFFIVDGDLTVYVIPMLAVGGRTRILLRAYKKYIVGNASGLRAAVTRAALRCDCFSRKCTSMMCKTPRTVE